MKNGKSIFVRLGQALRSFQQPNVLNNVSKSHLMWHPRLSLISDETLKC